MKKWVHVRLVVGVNAVLTFTRLVRRQQRYLANKNLRHLYRTQVCRYNWHSAGSLGWPFPMLRYKYIFQIKYTEAILANSTWKLLWFEMSKMLTAV